MVTPQQRGQVVVKSIGDIQRETTVRARKARPSASIPNLGHTVTVPTAIQGIGILNKYYKIAQNPVHTAALTAFMVNSSPVSYSRTLKGRSGKIMGTAKMVLWGHTLWTVGSVGLSMYLNRKK